MRRLSSWIVATPSVGCGVTSSPFSGRSPPPETKVARTVSNDLQRSIPPCAWRTKFKSSLMGALLYLPRPGSRERDARASHECRAVVVNELGQRARGAAGDPLEGVRRVVVLAGKNRP